MAVPWYIIKHYFQKYSKFATATGSLFVITLVFYSYIPALIIAWSFLLGIAVAYSFLSTDYLVPNVLFMYSRKRKKGAASDDELTLMKTVCTVCGLRKCPRHRPELNILAFQPWTNLEIRRRVDEAAEEFLTIILNEFIYTWYKNLSQDEEFVDELRTSLRFFFSVFLRRAQKVDVPTFVTDKLIRSGLQHLHAYLKAKKTAHPGADLQEVTLEYLGPHLHRAMYSRKSELEYLRRLVEKLLPYVLRPQALHSRPMCALVREILAGSVLMPAMDAIANPDMVNNIILIFLDDSPPPEATEPPSEYVPFLGNFNKQMSIGSLGDPEQVPKISKSCLRLVLGDVMNPDNPKMLYPFMQFLKSEAAVNVLQFALSCEDFNKQILNPDLSQEELVDLHNTAKDLYKNYCCPTAPDRIKFEENLVNELKEIIEGPVEGILKLRTSTPMFRAYEHVYNLLSYTFLPLYHQSDDYYSQLCGMRVAEQNESSSRASSNSHSVPKPLSANIPRQQKKKEFNISTIGTKIKEVFKSQDSKSLGGDTDSLDDLDAITIASSSSLEDDIPGHIPELLEEGLEEFRPHDLSAWRVTIPRIGARLDSDKKQYYTFIIDIRRADMSSDGKEGWTVERKYAEFYVLETKLTEFHGEFEGCQLPQKKMLGTNNLNFVDRKREAFEQYLQKLLTMPSLKGSQLLYNFLTPNSDFSSGFDINLGKMFKSVPMKLVKEKGQHLESFLQSLSTSTEAPKPRPSKQERRDSGASFISSSSEKLIMGMYENNASCYLDKVEYPDGVDMHETVEVEGVFDSLIYVARYVYSVPDWFHHVLFTARMLAKNTLESYLDWYIGMKVQQVTQEHRLVGFVHLLRDVLFFDDDPPRTDEQKKSRFEQTLKGCLDFIPKPFVSVIGGQNHQNGTKLVLDALQQPKLNKQLTYVFLDIAMQELFPELRE